MNVPHWVWIVVGLLAVLGILALLGINFSLTAH